MNPGEQFDAMVEAHMKKVADENEDVVIVNGKPHLKIERDGESAYCFFDHRFWYRNNPNTRYYEKRGLTYPAHFVCPASEDYSEQEAHSD